MTYTHIIPLLLIALMVTVVSCDRDDEMSPIPVLEEVNLRALSHGQQTIFVRLDAICGLDTPMYSGDTIIWRVVEEDGNLFFEEQFTVGSPQFDANPMAVRYPVVQEDNYILIPSREESALFFFYGNDTIFTQPEHTAVLTQSECLPFIVDVPFEGDEIAFMPEFDLFGISLRNETVVSCVPVIFDLEAYLCYKEGVIDLSYTLSSGFPGLTFVGWERLD